MRTFLVTIAVALAGLPAPLPAQTGAEAEVQKVVADFHTGIRSGTTSAVMQLLASDVLLMEAGGIETRAQYEKDHLPGDIEFEKSVTTAFQPYRVTVMGDVAWAVSTSEYKGTFRDRPIDSLGVELMVLSRETSGWRIRAIHWSSRARRPAP
jgi:ketosteroid isomerase-like protein